MPSNQLKVPVCHKMGTVSINFRVLHSYMCRHVFWGEGGHQLLRPEPENYRQQIIIMLTVQFKTQSLGGHTVVSPPAYYLHNTLRVYHVIPCFSMQYQRAMCGWKETIQKIHTTPDTLAQYLML